MSGGGTPARGRTASAGCSRCPLPSSLSGGCSGGNEARACVALACGAFAVERAACALLVPLLQICREHGIIILEDDAYFWLQVRPPRPCELRARARHPSAGSRRRAAVQSPHQRGSKSGRPVLCSVRSSRTAPRGGRSSRACSCRPASSPWTWTTACCASTPFPSCSAPGERPQHTPRERAVRNAPLFLLREAGAIERWPHQRESAPLRRAVPGPPLQVPAGLDHWRAQAGAQGGAADPGGHVRAVLHDPGRGQPAARGLGLGRL